MTTSSNTGPDTPDPRALWSKVKSYGAFCDEQLRDTTDLLDDVQSEVDGWRLVLAVDFTELFCYSMRSGAAAPLWPVGYFSPQFIEFTESTAAQCWFGNKSRPTVLLEPYALECRKHLHEWMAESIVDAARAYAEWQSILQKSTGWIVELTQILEAGQAPSAAQLKLITSLLTDYAPQLLSVLKSSKEGQFRTLSDLLSSGVFTGLAGLVGPIDALDADRIGARREELFEIRRRRVRKSRKAMNIGGRASSHLDAIALELVDLANLALQPKRTKIMLISRSPAMADLDALEVSMKIVQRSRVRHPRVATLALEAPGLFRSVYGLVDPSALAAKKVERHAALSPVSDSISTAKKNGVQIESKTCDELYRRVKEVLDGFEALVFARAANAALLAQRELAYSADPPASHGLDWSLLRALTLDSNAILSALKERVESMASRLQQANAWLGWGLWSGMPDSFAALRQHLRFEHVSDKLVLRSTSNPVPYTLELTRQNSLRTSPSESQELKQWTALVNVLETEFGDADLAQRLLFMGYTLAMLSQWQLAEQYCMQAVKAVIDAERSDLSEAWFFLGVCQRKYKPTPARCREALWNVSLARRQARATRGVDDPRHLVEVAAIRLAWISMRQELQDSSWSAPVERWLPRIAAQLRKAEQGAAADRELLLYVYNVRCYLGIVATQAGMTPAGSMDDVVSRLHTLALECEPAFDRWPLYLLDTVAYSMFVAGWPYDQFEPYLIVLERQHKSPEYPHEDLARIKRHVLEMRSRHSA